VRYIWGPENILVTRRSRPSRIQVRVGPLWLFPRYRRSCRKILMVLECWLTPRKSSTNNIRATTNSRFRETARTAVPRVLIRIFWTRNQTRRATHRPSWAKVQERRTSTARHCPRSTRSHPVRHTVAASISQTIYLLQNSTRTSSLVRKQICKLAQIQTTSLTHSHTAKTISYLTSTERTTNHTKSDRTRLHIRKADDFRSVYVWIRLMCAVRLTCDYLLLN